MVTHQRTDRRWHKASYRDAWTHLKSVVVLGCWETELKISPPHLICWFTCAILSNRVHSYFFQFKAVKTKSVRDYVKWMMYWIVFALFLCAETVSDVLVSWWMPFYYEIKIVFLLWLLSPYTKGNVEFCICADNLIVTYSDYCA